MPMRSAPTGGTADVRQHVRAGFALHRQNSKHEVSSEVPGTLVCGGPPLFVPLFQTARRPRGSKEQREKQNVEQSEGPTVCSTASAGVPWSVPPFVPPLVPRSVPRLRLAAAHFLLLLLLLGTKGQNNRGCATKSCYSPPHARNLTSLPKARPESRAHGGY